MSADDTPQQHEVNSKKHQTLKIPVVEEYLEVGKEKVETGRVRIHKDVIDREVSVDIPLQREQISVTRVPKNEDITEAPQVRYEGDTTIIPVVKEVVVVQKKLVLVEEIHIKREVETEVEEIHATVRKESIDIERI